METAKKSPARPKRRNREESILRFQKAALEVFSKVGYDAATTRMVAKRAGLNESLINRYFEGKSGLLLSVLNSYVAAEQAAVAKHPVAETLLDEILFFFDYQMEKCWRMRELMKIVISRSFVDKKISQEMANRVGKAGIPHLLPRLEALKAKGKIRADADLLVTAHALSSVAFTASFMAQVVFGRDKEEIRQNLQETARLFLRALAP